MTEKIWHRVRETLFTLAIVLMICEWLSGLSPAIGTLLLVAGLYAAWLGEAAGRREDWRTIQSLNQQPRKATML